MHVFESKTLFNYDDSELFIGLVAHVGTNKSVILDYLKQSLKNLEYEIIEVRITTDVFELMRHPMDHTVQEEYERIKNCMDAGNEIRSKFESKAILANAAIAYVSALRRKGSVASGLPPEAAGGEEGANTRTEDLFKPKKRHAYIISSLKRPEEVHRLRECYAGGFYLIGVYEDENLRIDHLKRKKMNNEQAKELVFRDYSESDPFGQRTSSTFPLADFFLYADDSQMLLQKRVERIVSLMFGAPHKTPYFDEFAMYMAFATSLRSADLSRQVGAVITNDKREIIAYGANDCPQYGGGLYWADDLPEYNPDEKGPDFVWGFDSNTIIRNKMIEEILETIAHKLNGKAKLSDEQGGEEASVPPAEPVLSKYSASKESGQIAVHRKVPLK